MEGKLIETSELTVDLPLIPHVENHEEDRKLWESTLSIYEDFLSKGDPRVESWFLMSSPFPSIAIMLLYLIIVMFGPRMMKNCDPFQLKPLLATYNILQICLSFYMFQEFLVVSLKSNYNYSCMPVDYSTSELAMRMAGVCWLFYFSKIIDLCDTLFFIVRKKSNQLTFLHVYHHCSMIANWWLGVKFAAGGQACFPAMGNSLVHALMYTYYYISSLGPQLQKYLWWKRYLTQIQMVQFFVMFGHAVYSLYSSCDYPKWIAYISMSYIASLIILFSNFYLHAYMKKSNFTKILPFYKGSEKQE